jgi:predicted Zn-ribbon and HTH transcriptional regulator
MSELDRDNPGASSEPQRTVHRLHDARRERAKHPQQQPQARARLREDPMMSLKVRPRRKRCKRCRYRFDYRMYTNRCPECGRYRDDYPRPNHGLQAMVFGGVVVGALCVAVAVAIVLQMV